MATKPNPDKFAGVVFTPRYDAAVNELLGVEGGLTEDKTDRGGTTKYGISLRFLASEGAFDSDRDGKLDFDLDMDGDIDADDVRALTISDARYLYHRCFWTPLKADTFPMPIGEMLFDQGVNGGLVSAGKLLQRAINTSLMEASQKFGSKTCPSLLLVDGALGLKSIDAMLWVLRYNALGMTSIVANFRSAVRDRYRAIVARYPDQQKFLRGWLARAERLGRVA